MLVNYCHKKPRKKEEEKKKRENSNPAHFLTSALLANHNVKWMLIKRSWLLQKLQKWSTTLTLTFSVQYLFLYLHFP